MRGFFAQFILSGQSEILRCAQDDSERLRMTGGGVNSKHLRGHFKGDNLPRFHREIQSSLR